MSTPPQPALYSPTKVHLGGGCLRSHPFGQAFDGSILATPQSRYRQLTCWLVIQAMDAEPAGLTNNWAFLVLHLWVYALGTFSALTALSSHSSLAAQAGSADDRSTHIVEATTWSLTLTELLVMS
jgi:hypothetical protein